MDAIGRILLVLLVPIVWGLVSAWAFDKLRLRRERRTERKDSSKEEEPE